MYVTSPEQRHEMWDDAVAHRGGERRTRLHYIALDIHAELSALHLYTDYREPLIEAVQTLDAADRFLDHSMLMAYQSLGMAPEEELKAEAPARLLALLGSRLREVAASESLELALRTRASELAEFWRATVQESEESQYLTVSQLAARHGVTPQAVYKWIHSGKIEAEERPGGSYRIPAGQFRSSARLQTKRAATRRKLLALYGETTTTDEEIVEALRTSRQDNDSG